MGALVTLNATVSGAVPDDGVAVSEAWPPPPVVVCPMMLAVLVVVPPAFVHASV